MKSITNEIIITTNEMLFSFHNIKSLNRKISNPNMIHINFLFIDNGVHTTRIIILNIYIIQSNFFHNYTNPLFSHYILNYARTFSKKYKLIVMT